ncbi:MAG: YHYH protein [Lysobacterales bacterium]
MDYRLLLIPALVAGLSGAPAHAVSPDVGLWIIDAENTGQPGRGLQIEVQDGTVVMTFYGYLPNGAAQWYLAVGALTGSSFSGTLETYRGGTAFGQPHVPAQSAGSAGTVTMTFSDNSHGTITLPGESAKAISRVQFGNVLSVPDAPTALSATPGNGSATLSFAPPANTGGSPVTSYLVRCSASGMPERSATGPSSPLLVTGMNNGSVYSCSVSASNAQGAGPASLPVSVTPAAGGAAAFALSTPVAANGGVLPVDYTCDGMGSTPALSWSDPPAGTRAYALLMTTLPGDGSTKWNWVLYNIPAGRTALARDSYGIGSLGIGSDGPVPGYQAPCSQGPGAKIYTFTLYALSGDASLSLPPDQISGAAVQAAIAPLTLGSASLSLSVTRAANPSGSATACLNVRNSTNGSTSGRPAVNCDASYAYVGSDGLPTHAMMDGIVGTNLQVPIGQNFRGANAWKIPLQPIPASAPVSAVDGPIGVAVNGVPIFNPCKQGGCQNGDTKALGELDVCNGHAGRADDYHYHAAPTCLMAGRAASYWDTHPVGWALDGYAIFGYNNPDGTPATRDAICGGNTSPGPNAPSAYAYHVTEVSPYVLSCFYGVPSPDLANQASKFSPIRQPPVTPFTVSNMSLRTDSSDGYQVLEFSSARNFTTTSGGTTSYPYTPGSYRIRYKALSGAALMALLTQPQNSGKSACWSFQFTDTQGAATQPSVSYCR